MAQALPGSEYFEQSLVMFERRAFALSRRRFGAGFAMRKVIGDIANEPGPPDRGAADHHRVRAGLRQNRRRVRKARTIAIRGHRNRYGLLHPADRRPVSLS